MIARKAWWARSGILALIVTSPYRAAGQEPAVDAPATLSRSMWDESLLKRRPAAEQTKPAARPPKYVRSKLPGSTSAPRPAPAGPREELEQTLIGITFWQLREPRPADGSSGERLLVMSGGAREELLPERVEAGRPLQDGQKIFLTVEVPSSGYVYIVDREQYADGSLSKPYLIFPSLRSRNGDNQVTAGRIIEIPAQDQKQPYFQVRRNYVGKTGQAQAGEQLYLIIAPKRIPGLNIVYDPTEISESQFARWQREWTVQTVPYELEGGAGTGWTRQEKEAGSGKILLDQSAPTPQTLLHVSHKPGIPLMVNLPMLLSESR